MNITQPRTRSEIALMLVDSHVIFRAGVRSVLAGTEFCVACEASTGKEALDLASRISLQLVLLDPRAPGHLWTLHALRQHVPSVPVILLMDAGDSSLEERAVAEGAVGCLPKTIAGDGLLRALRRVISGKDLAIRLREKLPVNAGRQAEAFSDYPNPPLTRREQEVLKLLATGSSNAQIAADLYVATSTVKTHVEHITRKLGVTTRVQAVSWAIRWGLVGSID